MGLRPPPSARDVDARRLALGALAAFFVGGWLDGGDQRELSAAVFLGAVGLSLAAATRTRPVTLGAAATAVLLVGVALGATGRSALGAWLDFTGLALGVLTAHRMGRMGADPGDAPRKPRARGR